MLKKEVKMVLILEYLCVFAVDTEQWVLTFMLLSPDSPQLSLGETDEENSTKPHVQPTVLPPSPTLLSLLSSSFSRFPSHFAGRTGRLTPPLPRLSSLSLRLCSPTQLFFPHLSQGLLLFSLLCLSLFSALRPCPSEQLLG